MTMFTSVLALHVIAAGLSVSLFALRYWWTYQRSPMLAARWVKVVPHGVDTVLFLSGAALIAITHYLPFTGQDAWLTERLFGVIIYIVLGFIALGRRFRRSQQVGFIAFLLGLVVLFIIIKLAITKIPLLG